MNGEKYEYFEGARVATHDILKFFEDYPFEDAMMRARNYKEYVRVHLAVHTDVDPGVE